MTAEICHIRSQRPRGPRHDPSQTPEERNSAANLLLMCGRHHKIIDTEVRKYTADVLLKIKQDHEAHDFAKISPAGTLVAEQLLSKYTQIAVIRNCGNVAIQSPGVIQAKTLTIKSTRAKLAVEPPVGSIGAVRAKVAYCQHLIDRYQDYQKADRTGKSNFKYAAIHVAIKRVFGVQWKLLDESQFEKLVGYLQKRIDSTIIGKLNRAEGHSNYSSFEIWSDSR